MTEITPWHWVGFICCVLILLGLDLGVFHKRAHVVSFREALTWTVVWFCLAMLFAWWLQTIRGRKESLEFLTGYLIEFSLSMDNVFVMALIFAHFGVPAKHQHRVLFWGILGALIMRGVMIGAGVALVYRLHWVLLVCGLFLIYTGFNTLFVKTKVEPEKNRVVKWARKLYPITPHLEGQKFVTHWQGAIALTPLALVLLMVETTDLVFAVDSIPAIFAVTTKPFIVFTSNVFAILGLRTLYFVLADAIDYFRYLKVGLSVVLVFIGAKMILDPPDQGPPFWFQVDIPISVSLMVVAGIILSSMVLSVIAGYREKRSGRPPASTGSGRISVSSAPASKQKPQGSSIIFLSGAYEVLLCLRDDKPTIPYPNQWDLLGGAVEPGETPLECIVREMLEEIEFELRSPAFFRSYDLVDRIEHVFWQHSTLEIAATPLHEGQRLRWFSEQEIRAMRRDELAFGFRDLLVDFYNQRPFEADRGFRG